MYLAESYEDLLATAIINKVRQDTITYLNDTRLDYRVVIKGLSGHASHSYYITNCRESLLKGKYQYAYG
jgi:hypothetical protein